MWVFVVIRPNSILHFAPFLSTLFFPCLNPVFKKGHFCPSSPFNLLQCQTIITVRVCVEASLAEGRWVLDTSRSEFFPSPEKRSIWAPTPSPRGLRQLTFRMSNDVGQKQYSPCFCEGVARRRPAMLTRKAG